MLINNLLQVLQIKLLHMFMLILQYMYLIMINVILLHFKVLHDDNQFNMLTYVLFF